MDKKKLLELKLKANEIRQLTLNSIFCAQSGHTGGALSIVDILTVLYFNQMEFCRENLHAGRDRFVLSKGHGCPSYYAALALKGFFPVSELATLRKLGSRLQGHPCSNKLPGVDASTGSLGQGLSISSGMAMMGKLDKKPYRVFCICGDGELQEGQIWESAMTASHYGLDNLTLFVDDNGLQIDGETKNVKNVESISEKFRAFGWFVLQIDGHNIEEIDASVEKAKAIKGVPTCIVAKTVKGKGVSFMENLANWHGQAPNKEQLDQAIRELEREKEATNELVN